MEIILKYNGFFQLLATIIIPIVVVWISIWYQDRHARTKAKMDLFLSLMAHRGSYPITQDWVDSLNRIDALFQDNKKVTTAWRLYFESLHETDPKSANAQTYQIELLSEIAEDLGFGHLKPSQIADFYVPKQFGNTLQTQNLIQSEMMRVLGNSHSYAESRKQEDNQENLTQ